MFRNTAKHLKNNAKYYILAFVFLILAGIIYKFQRELLTNVQQINKQVVEFVQQQYDQQRQIFGWALNPVGLYNNSCSGIINCVHLGIF